MKIRSKSKRLNNSFQKTFRNRHLIAVERKLNDQEYRLWDLYIALYDWDTRHEHFGCVVDTDLHIAEMINWSESKVCRYRNSLVEKGMVKMDERSVVKVWPIPGYDESRLNKNNPKLSTLEDQPLKTEFESFTTEPVRTQNSILSNFPNKDITSKFNINIEEYRELKDEYDNNEFFIGIDNGRDDEEEIIKMIKRNEELRPILEKFELENHDEPDNEEEVPF
jgi:DNA-directed RNA polymerase specialized sigma subunit